jgi:hypothetical protein
VITRYLSEDLSRSGVHAVPDFEGGLALDVRWALRGDLTFDRTALALTRRLNKAAPGVESTGTSPLTEHGRRPALGGTDVRTGFIA